MENTQKFENFPKGLICRNLFITLLTYSIGTAVLWLIHYGYGIAYALLVFLTLFLAWALRCPYCYYYGKDCASGFGKIAARIFKKGESSEFTNPKKIIPVAFISVIVMFAPIIAAIVDLSKVYTHTQLILLILYIIIALPISGMIRQQDCAHCKQGEIGCPANKRIKNEKKKEEKMN